MEALTKFGVSDESSRLEGFKLPFGFTVIIVAYRQLIFTREVLPWQFSLSLFGL